MCLICSEWVKSKLTIQEQIKAGYELINTIDDEAQLRHIEEVVLRLMNNDSKENSDISK